MAAMESDSPAHRPAKEGAGADHSNLYEIDPPDDLAAGVASDVVPVEEARGTADAESGAGTDPDKAEVVSRPPDGNAWESGSAAATEFAGAAGHAAEPVAEPAPAETGYSGVAAPPAGEPAVTTAGDAAPHASGESDRRDFLKKAAAVVVGGTVVAVPVVAGLSVLVDPLRRGASGDAPFLPVAPLDAVPADGSPMQFPVKADRTDAWNQFRNVPVGAVFLKRVGDAVKAFNVVCPHAGCFVQPKADGSFLCPCHNSTFHPDGTLAPESVSPRGLDELAVKLEGEPGRQTVLVRFQNFQPATSKKHPV
jgi:menaquinol-cytochrome c reductase iron-sulfur subunit